MKKIDRAIDHSNKRISKKNRSKLLQAVVQSYERNDIDYFDVQYVCNSIENIHNASLIIDDLPMFDNDAERSGIPTTHVVYGEQTALLAAISIIFKSFKGELNSDIIDELSKMGMQMCKGQSLEFDDEIDIHEYHALKTGSMFLAVCRIGAIMCDANPDDWNEFAHHLGLLYQLNDDLEDINQNDIYNLANEIKDINIDQYMKNVTRSIPHNVNEDVIILFLQQCLNK